MGKILGLARRAVKAERKQEVAAGRRRTAGFRQYEETGAAPARPVIRAWKTASPGRCGPSFLFLVEPAVPCEGPRGRMAYCHRPVPRNSSAPTASRNERCSRLTGPPTGPSAIPPSSPDRYYRGPSCPNVFTAAHSRRARLRVQLVVGRGPHPATPPSWQWGALPAAARLRRHPCPSLRERRHHAGTRSTSPMHPPRHNGDPTVESLSLALLPAALPRSPSLSSAFVISFLPLLFRVPRRWRLSICILT